MKRSVPMKRTPFKARPPEASQQPGKKPVKCKAPGCQNRFVRRSMTHKACGQECAAVLGRLANEKAAARAALEDRRQTRAQLEDMKTVPQLKKEAQAAFNKWVRLRDAGRPCISCGAPPPNLTKLHAGRDAGHYRSIGSADHLRFHEDNCHAQCVKCNQWGAGMAVDYRLGLIARIGAARVHAIECSNAANKWTRHQLREIREIYRERTRLIEKRSANDAMLLDAA
ncbi:Bacteriophage Lambda NinG protein [Roseateles sp. YR242]|uniref:recombination protein NinG n=1 Tax=Roseateles sp. YR242 TaxID=1855305 RepID=UPI0008B3A2ED|nr:recombination protein NinG [Roseateles sp. YR242]SEL12673.1 Bacteriophage Lambda NinG protein [Roseateles sp. YR242]